MYFSDVAQLLKSQQENNTQWQVFILVIKIQSRQQRSRLRGAKGSPGGGGGQNLKLSTKAAVFKKVNFLFGGPSMPIGGPNPLAPALPRSLFLSRQDPCFCFCPGMAPVPPPPPGYDNKCSPGTKSCEMGPAIRYTLLRINASIIKI